MNASELQALVDQHLGVFAHQSGTVLYSGLDTLKKGDFYVVGLNPAGSPSAAPTTIRDSVPHETNWSAYTQDCWRDHGDGECTHMLDGRVMDHFLDDHQKHAQTLFEALGRKAETIFSTNCVFARSKKEETFRTDVEVGGSLADWEAACWPVHQTFLDIVRPEWIISFGFGVYTSAFGFWRKRIGNPDWREIGNGRPGGGGGWKFNAKFDLGAGREPLATRFLGIPHPSYFEIGPDLQSFILEHVRRNKTR